MNTPCPTLPIQKIVITFGTFDLLHVGHINILRRAKALGSRLIVGVSTDELNFKKKGFFPIFGQNERISIISALRDVDQVFLEESLEAKLDYIRSFKADILVMGDDWLGKFDFATDLCDVVYLPRTPEISTSELKVEIVKKSLR